MSLREEVSRFLRLCEAAAKGNAKRRGMKKFAAGQRWAAGWLKAILENTRST